MLVPGGLTACGGGPASPDAEVAPDAEEMIPPRTITARVEAGAPDAPVRAFFRHGAGPWQRVEGDGEGNFSFEVTHRRYAFGMTCVTPTFQDLLVAVATVDDPAPLLTTPCDGPSTSPAERVTVTGTLGPLHPSGYHGSVGDWPVGAVTAPETAAYGARPRAGVATFAFARMTASVADWIAIFRDVPVAAGTTLDADLDTDGFAPQEVALAATGGGSGVVAFDAFFTPAGNATIALGQVGAGGAVPAVPADRRVAGDVTKLRAFRAEGAASVQRLREVLGAEVIPSQLTLELPPQLRDARVATTGGALPIRARAEPFTELAVPPTDYMLWINASSEHDDCLDGACFPYWLLTATPAAAGGAVELTTLAPDELVAIDAWDPRLALELAAQPSYGFYAYWRHGDGESFTGLAGSL